VGALSDERSGLSFVLNTGTIEREREVRKSGESERHFVAGREKEYLL
jgi:hypothetical protein